MKREYRFFVEDIHDCIEKIEEFTAHMSFEEFVNDDKTKSAVIRKLEIIGEASKNIPRDIRQKHKDLPWSDMAKMRDKIIHGYFGINYQIVWKVVKEKPMKQTLNPLALFQRLFMYTGLSASVFRLCISFLFCMPSITWVV